MRFEGTSAYVATDDLKVAVNAAIALERPLLVKGEPGTGKTVLAIEIAKALSASLIEWHIKSTTKAQQGLYEYDAVTRLRDSQLGDARVKDIRNYIKRGKLWEAFVADERPVLLIDEIDKADIEFPNDLLQELDRMEFFVYETGETIHARRRPIVVITSNNEKELPDAFLRRCFFHYIRFPDADTMRAIVAVHFPGIKQRLVAEALRLFYEIRDVPGMKKKPSTSELLDWLKLLMVEDVSPETLRERDPKRLIPPLHGALLKNEQDVHLFGMPSWRAAKAAKARGLPPRMHAEGISRAEPVGELVRRAALRDQRRIGNGVSQPFVFDEAVRRPLLIEEIFDFAAGAVGVKAAARVIGRQRRQTRRGCQRRGGRRLGRRDAEIRRNRLSRLEGYARASREAELIDRDHGVDKEIAGDAGFAAEALADFAAHTQPRHRPEFGEAAGLHGVMDAGEAIELLVRPAFPFADDFDRRAEFERAEINDIEAETVARSKKIRRRASFANAEKRQAGHREFAAARTRPFRHDTALDADGDDPVRHWRRIGCRRRRRRCCRRQIRGSRDTGRA
jgi:MoxR-like ATPase